MKTSDFDYHLPPESIAQNPAEPRDAARLLVLNRSADSVGHFVFRDIAQFFSAGDLLVLNQTRVIPARLVGKKIPDGGRCEALLLHRLDDTTWEALVGGKHITPGKSLAFSGGPKAVVVEALDGPRRVLRFSEPVEPYLEKIGHTPLPPYIQHSTAPAERYQTVYARVNGSAAAPTAGLHFTPELLEMLQAQGVQVGYVTLHIGLDTFAPVREENPSHHQIHTEWCEIPEETARLVNQTARAGGRVVGVGTTSVRSLETAAQFASPGERIAPFQGSTDLYILPGYSFKAVDAIITNFHLPKSTLIMMISAFAGRERVLNTYQLAVQEGYRFYSFGDAMLIV